MSGQFDGVDRKRCTYSADLFPRIRVVVRNEMASILLGRTSNNKPIAMFLAERVTEVAIFVCFSCRIVISSMCDFCVHGEGEGCACLHVLALLIEH